MMNNSKLPLLSVLMTSYNREQYIAEAIESVLASTYTNFELIIVDDCSKDNTVEIALSFARKDPRINVFVNEKNLGDYPNRNKAASYAKGKYLKYLDADDLIYRFGLEAMVMYMEQFSTAGFGLSFPVIDDVEPYPRFISSTEIIRNEYLQKSYLGVGPSASIILRSAFEAIGGFSGTQYIGDTELWLTLAAKYPMVLMNPSLNWWRQHPDQQIKQELKNPEIPIKRLKLSLTHLELNRDFFTPNEYEYGAKRRKQHFSRSILADVFKSGAIGRFIFYYRNSGINLSDLLSGFQKYM